MEAVTKPHYSIPSLVAIVAAIVSFFVSALPGFILALVAIVCAVVGIMMSMSPSVRGGVVSMLALLLGGIGAVVAIIRAIAWLVHGHPGA